MKCNFKIKYSSISVKSICSLYKHSEKLHFICVTFKTYNKLTTKKQKPSKNQRNTFFTLNNVYSLQIPAFSFSHLFTTDQSGWFFAPRFFTTLLKEEKTQLRKPRLKTMNRIKSGSQGNKFYRESVSEFQCIAPEDKKAARNKKQVVIPHHFFVGSQIVYSTFASLKFFYIRFLFIPKLYVFDLCVTTLVTFRTIRINNCLPVLVPSPSGGQTLL